MTKKSKLKLAASYIVLSSIYSFLAVCAHIWYISVISFFLCIIASLMATGIILNKEKEKEDPHPEHTMD